MGKSRAEKIRQDPVFFIEEVLGDDLWQKQKEIARSVANNERTAVKACHGPGKTWISGRIVLWFLHAYEHSIVVTTAPTFSQVKDLLWKEIRSAHSQSKYELLGKMLDTRLTIADDWYAVGRSTNEPTRFQGFHAPHILVVVDEASGVERQIYEAIDGVLSAGKVRRLLLIGNPTDPSCYFAERFKKANWEKITISAFDTPNFEPFKNKHDLLSSSAEDRKKAVTHPFLVSPDWVFDKHADWGEDHPAYQSRVLGNFPQQGDDHLISLADAEFATRNNEVSTDGERVLGVDVARFGSDSTQFYGRQGGYVFFDETVTKRDTVQVASQSSVIYNKEAFEIVGVDDTGLGGGVTDQLKQMGVNVVPLNFAAAPKNKKLFHNLRDEIFWELRDAFVKRKIRIKYDEELITQLTSIKYTYKNGKLKIERKEEIKKRVGASPDKADALAICWYTSKQSKNAFLSFAEEEGEPKKPEEFMFVDKSGQKMSFTDFIRNQ